MNENIGNPEFRFGYLTRDPRIIEVYPLADLKPQGNVWQINDAGSPSTEKFTALKDFLFENPTIEIELQFTNMKAIPKDALYSTGILGVFFVSAHEATSIGSNAFNNCYNLRIAEFPSVKAIGDSAFNDCSALTTLIIAVASKLETLDATVFGGTTPVANIKVTTHADNKQKFIDLGFTAENITTLN